MRSKLSSWTWLHFLNGRLTSENWNKRILDSISGNRFNINNLFKATVQTFQDFYLGKFEWHYCHNGKLLPDSFAKRNGQTSGFHRKLKHFTSTTRLRVWVHPLLPYFFLYYKRNIHCFTWCVVLIYMSYLIFHSINFPLQIFFLVKN